MREFQMVKLFEQLRDLSLKQSQAIEGNKTEELAGLVRKKQGIIDKIEETRRQIKGRAIPPEIRQKIAYIISEQERIEKENEKKLQLLINKLGKDVAGIAKGRLAAKSYLTHGNSVTSRFFDIAE